MCYKAVCDYLNVNIEDTGKGEHILKILAIIQLKYTAFYVTDTYINQFIINFWKPKYIIPCSERHMFLIDSNYCTLVDTSPTLVHQMQMYILIL